MEVKRVLWIYDFSDPKEYLDTPIKKLHWKSMVTKIDISCWTETFQTLKPYFGWDIETQNV